MGVRRALNIALETISNKNTNETIFTYGPLIHNKQVVELLESRGVNIINTPSDLKKYNNSNSTVIIRSHGISPHVKQELIAIGANLCDATCPRVTRVQSIIKKYYDNKYDIIIIGDKGHAEVEGLLGFTDNNGHVISTYEDALKLPQFKKVCVVGQTTQDEKTFVEITNILKQKYSEIEIFDTICDSTSMRQKELEELSIISDAIIVVGGKNSANTARLANIVKAKGTPSFHVETADEITKNQLENYDRISITAGASTPNWVFQEVVEKVTDIQKRKEPFWKRSLLSIEQGILKSNVFLSLGAISLTYTSCILQGIRPRFLYLLLSFLYIFSMHALNQFTEHATIGFNYPGKKHFYDRHSKILITSGILSGIFSILLAMDISYTVFIILCLATLMGIIYQAKIIPDKWINIFKYQKLKDIPASKDIFLALAWVLVIVIFPLLGAGIREIKIHTLVATIFTFTLIFIRSVLYGIKEVQGDRMIGKETLPILMGEKNSGILINALSIFLFTSLLLSSLTGEIPSIGFYLLIIPLCILIYNYYYKKIVLTGNLFDFVIDSCFLLAGLITFLVQKL